MTSLGAFGAVTQSRRISDNCLFISKRFGSLAIFLTLATTGAIDRSSYSQENAPSLHPMDGAVRPAAMWFEASSTNDTTREPSLLATPETVAAAIDALGKNLSIDAAFRDRLLAVLNEIAEHHKQRAADADRLAGNTKALATVADSTRRARAIVELPEIVEEAPLGVDRMSIERVRELRSDAEANAEAARLAVQNFETTIRERQTQKELLPKLIQEARKNADELESSSIADVEGDSTGRLKSVREAERVSRLAALRKRIELRVQEQSLIEAETDLLPLKLTIAKRELTKADARVQWWSTALRERRESQIEAALVEHRQVLKLDGIKPDQSMVLSLASRWMEVIADIERTERKLVRNQARCDELSQTLQSTRDEIKRDLEVSGSLPAGLGLKLQLQRNKLPKSTNLRSEVDRTDAKIEETRILLTRLEFSLEETAGGPINGISFGDTTTLPTKDGKVHPGEVQLLKRLAADLDQEITKLLELRALYELKRSIVSNLRLEIDSHVLWIRNASRYSIADATTAWAALRWILQPTNLTLLGNKLIAGSVKRVDRVALIFAAVIFLAFFASRLRKQLVQFGKQASMGSANSLRPTWTVLLLTVILTLPIATVLWAVGGMLAAVAEREAIVLAFSAACIFGAGAFIPLELLRQVLRPDGLAISHFGVNEKAVVPLRLGLRVLIDVGLPIIVLWSVCQSLGRTQVDATLGRLLFAIGMGLVAMLLWQSFHPATGLFSARLKYNQTGWLSRLRMVWFPSIVGIPLALAGVSLFGYSYTSAQLVERLYWTLWIAIATFLAGGMVKRWLLIQRRRLAWAVQREKSQHTERMEGSVLEIAAGDSMEAAEINAQTSRLIQTALTIAALVGIAVVWSPVLPAVRFLESFQLWDTTLADGTLKPITLANLVLAVPIVVLTIVAVRNLPGLVEGVLLERLPLEKAVRYAITTLASYSLMAIGLLFAAKTLGLRWESIQWLVAALGVGLGFGLQEIFANFVSGIILLFEQPIRIGDVVTLGDTTGVVSKIRIRATTVTNWDRQELIIPNKDLITGRLVNWTLSDSTNRILLNVGVAYGTDTRHACRLLESICRQHPQVVDDPKPVITFDGFGDSTLNLVMRCYLTAIDVRLQTAHDLHTAINESFKEAGIEISFPQRDLHVRSLPIELANLMHQERAAA